MKVLLSCLLLLLVAGNSYAYPLDAAEQTGIARLEGYQLFQEGKAKGRKLFPGALLGSEQIKLRMTDHVDLPLPEVDQELTDAVIAHLGEEIENSAFPCSI